MSGVDVSDVGTGISFSPATKFPHMSGDAVQALGSGITLDSPLAKAHAYGAAVVNPLDTTAGYQGPPAPNQWFGGALSARAGSIALLDASGVVVVDADGLRIAAEQFERERHHHQSRARHPRSRPGQGRLHRRGAHRGPRRRAGGLRPAATNRSVGRFPDGATPTASAPIS